MTSPKRPLKVFPSASLRASLCHAHADRDAVRALYARLTQDGVDAWLDKEKLLQVRIRNWKPAKLCIEFAVEKTIIGIKL